MKLIKLNGVSLALILPIEILRAKGWVKGDAIKCQINKDGDIVLKKEVVNA